MPAISGSVPVTGFVAPTDDADTFAAHTEEWGRGGYRTVANITERNAIPAGRRKEGMRVYVVSTGLEYVLGSGLLDADWSAGKSVTNVATIADLEALNSSGIQNGAMFHVLNRSTANDGGGGWFYFDSSSSVARDGNMVAAPATGTGRFLREWDTEIRPQWFGASDSMTSDASSALQAAIDFAARPTYGWQGYAGQSSTPLSPDDLTKYNGCFKVKCVGAFALYSTVYLRDGVLLEGKPGSSSGDFGGNTIFHIWHGGIGFVVEVNRVSNGNRIGGMRDLTFACLAHTYQPNKKTITAVTDRFTFKVADADAPPTLDDTTIRPANNTCFFYDPNGEYLGSARISSTSSSAGQTAVNLFNDGTDAFSSINGTSGGALTTSCKVVWPVRVSDEYTSLGSFNDPGLAGTVAVSVRNTSSASVNGTPLMENLHAWGFHSAFRFGPGILWSGAPMRDLRSGRHKFAGISFARPDNTTDFVISGGTIFQGYYALDFSQVLPSNSAVSVSATSPAVFTKAGHGYTAGSRIRFGATGSMPGGISSGTGYPGTGYYVQSTGLTADTFQVSTSFIGTSVDASSTGSGVYIAGNVIDQPALQHGTYGIFNAPTFSRWDSTIAEFSAYANVYASRIIGPHFKYLFCDGSLRHGLVLGAGYNQFVSPTSSSLTDWVSVDHLIVKPGLPGSPYDTLHTNSVAVYFEKPLDTTRFAGAAIGTFSAVRAQTGGPQFTHAFDLQPAAYNNRAKIGLIAENNGYAAWRNPTGVSPEIDTPNLTTAADIDTGWYRPSATQRDFAVSGTRLLSLTSGNLLVEKTGGASLFTLKNTTSGTTVATTVGTGTLTWDNTADSLRLGTVYSDSGQATLFLGNGGTAGTTRASFIKAESAAAGATDKAAGTFYIFGSGGTGSSSTGGDIQFWTFDAGSSGTTVQSSSAKVRIPRVGGIFLPGQASDPSATSSGHFYFNSTTRNFRFWDGSYWQPLSLQADERNVASASTVNLGFQDSDKIYITGTTAITSFGLALGGTRRNVRFEGALTLTYNGSSMLLPGGVDILTEAGDTLEAVCISNANWRVISYTRASGAPLFTLSKIATISVDASGTFTFSPASSSPTQVLTAPITADRTVTLSTISAKNGQTARFTRTAASTGAFNWSVGGLKNLAVSQWCEVGYDGSAWVLLQFGSL